MRRTRATPVDPEGIEGVLGEAERAPEEPDVLLREAIVECRDKLPPKPRQAFDSRLASAGGQDDVELAEALGMKLNTFLQNFTRARQLRIAQLGS